VEVFRLERVALDNSSLPIEAVEAAWRPFVGRTVDAALLDELTKALAQLYARSDIALYAIVIPAQTPRDGLLRLSATEGFVNTVAISGTDRKKLAKAIMARADRLREDRPLRKATLDRVTALLGDIPGVTAEIGFATDPQTGETTATIKVAAKSVQGGASVDRRGITLLGRTHAQIDIQGNSVFTGADQLRVSILSSVAEDSIQYQSMSYQTPIDGHGSTLTFQASRQRTRATLLPLDGRARSFGMQFAHPLWRGARRSLYLTAGLDGTDSHNALLGYTLSNDRVRTVRAGASYVSLSDSRLASIGVTASRGLGTLGARVTPGQAETRFTKVTMKANVAQALDDDVALRAALFGQWTGDRLPASEQASLGGDEFGRGYRASATSGDIGVAGSVELAWRPSAIKAPLAGSELYLFADGGSVRMRARPWAAADSWSLASVGAGARVALASRHILEIEATQGLTDPVFYAPGKSRVVVSLRSSF
jgi:hemolysin activation/secretion protein